MELWQFKVRDLHENQSVPSSFEVTVKDIGFEVEDVVVIAPIQLDVLLFRTDRNVFTDANIQTAIRLQCGRCLKPLEQPLEASFSVQYQITTDPSMLDDPFADVGIRHYMGDYIDLTHEIRETLMLAIPSWPYCSEECQGLCPKCGQNLNEGTCNCPREEKRSGKLADLAQLLK